MRKHLLSLLGDSAFWTAALLTFILGSVFLLPYAHGQGSGQFGGGGGATSWSDNGTTISTSETVTINSASSSALFVPSGTVDSAQYVTNGLGSYRVGVDGGWNAAADGRFQFFNNAASLLRTFQVGNCIANGTAANPSVVSCSSNGTGMFSCSATASTGTCVVNTTAVTANSIITLVQTAADGGASQLNVTCNTANVLSTSLPVIASKSANTSFTINLGTVTSNPACFEYTITN